MGIFCASASPHPAAVGAVEAFLQVPCGGLALRLDEVALGCLPAVSVIAGLLGLGGPRQSLKLHTVPGCGPGKQALHFLLPSPGCSVLRSFGKCGNGIHQLLLVFPKPEGDCIFIFNKAAEAN